MTTVTKVYTFTNGTKADATEVNKDFDDIYGAINGNLGAANLANGIQKSINGIINVKDPAYNASGLATTSTGSITSGSKVLTLTTTPDFVQGQGINLQGAFEASSLQITGAATVSSNVTVTLNGVAYTVAVSGGIAEVASLNITAPSTVASNVTVTLNGVATNIAVLATDTAINVADKIRAATFTGWTTGGTVGTATVTFTANAVGVQTDATYSAGTTGAVGTMTTTTQGVNADTAINVATKIKAATYAGWTAGGTAGTDTVTFTSLSSGVKTDSSYSAGTTGAVGTITTTTQGTADQISTVSSVSGLVVNIADNSTRTIAAGTILHDDSTGINAATTALAAIGGGSIRFPYGTYRTTSSVNVPSNTILDFDTGAKIINSSDNSIFTHTADATNANITIKNAYIEGNHSGDTQYAILFSTGVSNVVIENCTINYTARGIRLDDCIDFKIARNTMNHNGFTTSATDQNSILVQATSTGDIVGNKVYDGTGAGIKVNATGDINVINNKAWRCSAIGFIAASTIHVRMIISENSFCYNGTTVTVNAEGGMNVHGLTNGIISKNICCYNYNYGIGINGDIAGATTFRTDNLIVTGNVVTNNNNIGIYIFESKRVIVDANGCNNNDGNIKVSGPNASEISITNNKCYDITYAVSTNNIDITQGTNILVENNYLGEINSIVTTVKEISVASTVTGGIMIGWNDFSLAKLLRCVVVNCTRTQIDFKHKQIWVSDEITLSAAAFNSPVLLSPPTGKYSCIWKVYAVYTEATSSDAGVTIGIGRNSVGNETYWATATSEVSKAINIRTQLTINRNGQLTDTTNAPWFYCIGGKVGLGKLKLVIEYLHDIPIYF